MKCEGFEYKNTIAVAIDHVQPIAGATPGVLKFTVLLNVQDEFRVVR